MGGVQAYCKPAWLPCHIILKRVIQSSFCLCLLLWSVRSKAIDRLLVSARARPGCEPPNLSNLKSNTTSRLIGQLEKLNSMHLPEEKEPPAKLFFRCQGVLLFHFFVADEVGHPVAEVLKGDPVLFLYRVILFGPLIPNMSNWTNAMRCLVFCVFIIQMLQGASSHFVIPLDLEAHYSDSWDKLFSYRLNR